MFLVQKIISEGSCDTENSTLPSQEEIEFYIY